jgi:hypothetical protein
MANIEPETPKNNVFDSFSSLIPVVYVLLAGNVAAWFATDQIQLQFFIFAWIITAAIVLRIQQLIQRYSEGRYAYKPGPCAALLVAVVLSPWMWLHIAAYPVNFLMRMGIVHNSDNAWLCAFTLAATATSLAFVTPMIEGWYEILRGAFAFDGTRIGNHKPSIQAQVSLFLIFCGILLAPIDMFGTKFLHIKLHSEATPILCGFFATFAALIWLLQRLESIRQTQLIVKLEEWCPIDRNLLRHAGRPMKDTFSQNILNRRRNFKPRHFAKGELGRVH